MSEKTKIIAIANQKGGVGKTTTVVNIAAGLVEKGKTVLCVDLDPQGNLSDYLGYTFPDDGRTICSANGGVPPAVKRKRYYESLVSAA